MVIIECRHEHAVSSIQPSVVSGCILIEWEMFFQCLLGRFFKEINWRNINLLLIWEIIPVMLFIVNRHSKLLSTSIDFLSIYMWNHVYFSLSINSTDELFLLKIHWLVFETISLHDRYSGQFCNIRVEWWQFNHW